MARLWSIPLRQQRSYSASCTVHSLNRVTALSAHGSRISAGLSIGECAVVQSPEIQMEHRTAGRDGHDLLRRDLTLKNFSDSALPGATAAAIEASSPIRSAV